MSAVLRDLARGQPHTTATFAPIYIGDPAPLDLVIYRGDTGRFRVTVTDYLGAPLDVSAAVFDADHRIDPATHPGQPDTDPPLTSFTVQPAAGDPSSVDVIIDELASQACENGVWDLEMRLAGEVVTLLAGNVTVTDDVSRTP